MSKYLKNKLGSLGAHSISSATSATIAAKPPSKASGTVDNEAYSDPASALLHVDAHNDGGLGCNNQEVLDSQRGVVSDVVKQIGKQLLTGRLNLINVSLPVKLFEPRSYLEKLADVWVSPRFLHQAAQTSDPVGRLKLVVAFFLSGIHLAFATWRKPFNPILGETWQALLGDGTAIFMEQISHHPPITAFQMVAADEAWEFSGLSQPDVHAKMQSNLVKTSARGYRCVSFRDGTSIQIVYPSYNLHGILMGHMRGDLAGRAEFLDSKHRLVATVTFGRVEGAAQPLLQRPDAVSCCICHMQEGMPVPEQLPSGLLARKANVLSTSLWSSSSLAARARVSNSWHQAAAIGCRTWIGTARGTGRCALSSTTDGRRCRTRCPVTAGTGRTCSCSRQATWQARRKLRRSWRGCSAGTRNCGARTMVGSCPATAGGRAAA